MTITIETVPPAIAAIAETVDGIESAKDPPPEAMETAALPCVYTLTGEAEDFPPDSPEDVYWETRVYRVQCAVLPKNQATPQTRELRIRPLIRALKAALVSHPSLGEVRYVSRAKVRGDSGPAILPEWDSKYLGFEIRVEVTSAVEVCYPGGE